jgi:hypothetical protein
MEIVAFRLTIRSHIRPPRQNFFKSRSVGPHAIAHIPHNRSKMHQGRRGTTHTGELDAAVTALGSSSLLLQVKVTELTAGGLDDANLVGPRVVPIESKKIRQ